MKAVIILPIVAVVVGLRLWFRFRRRAGSPAAPQPSSAPTSAAPTSSNRHPRGLMAAIGGDVGLVAAREVRERTKGRIFRVGTVLILVGVAAAIVIPVLASGKPAVQKVGVVGSLSAPLRHAVVDAGAAIQATVRLVPERSVASADAGLRSGRLSLVIVDAERLIVPKTFAPGDTSSGAVAVREVASALSTAHALQAAQLTPAQLSHLSHPVAVPVTGLQRSHGGTLQGTSLTALIVVFVLLQQYGTWTLMGVAEEKSSRVVEVLLSAVRPLQLLAGKVLGIGLVALAQSGTILVFALILAKAVGSNILHGAAPSQLLAAFVWLVLGYAFYCWVYAAAGSMAERPDQLQSLAFPLSLPIIVGYVTSLIAAGSGNSSPFLEVLAYLPPTAPFAMPVLKGLGQANWWEFGASVIVSIAGTVAMARFAGGVYRRAILRTGRGLRFREVVSRGAS